jgi:hypothetical protein
MLGAKYALPSQPRPHSLAHLEAEIVAQERVCTRWATRVETLEAAGQDSRAEYALLAIAEDRLVQLNRSRKVLLRGEEGYKDDKLT